MDVLKLRASAKRVVGIVDYLYWHLRAGVCEFLCPYDNVYALISVLARNVDAGVPYRQLDAMETCRDDE
ncbi:MAG TPA: hypothetical protein VGV14_09905 [Rhodanobacter sp.]|nr:hypothetical protein [Rhodanobacter sp.]